MRYIVIAIIAALCLSACVHVISEESRKGEEKSVPFRKVRQETEKYKGKVFVWGGLIINLKFAEKGGSQLEVLEAPLDKYGAVIDTDASEGRFIASFKEDLDPYVFEKGRLITVAGVLADPVEMSLTKEKKYLYPVLDVREFYLWKDVEYYPSSMPYTIPYWYGRRLPAEQWWYYYPQP